MKAFPKAVFCILLAFAGVKPCLADVLVYNYSEQQTTTKADATQTVRMSGQLVWDLATTNVAVVTWMGSGEQKTYFVQPATNYTIVTIHGPGRAQLTAMAPTPFGLLGPNVVAYTLPLPLVGKNGRLKTGTNKVVDLPSLFTAQDTWVSCDLQDESGNRLWQRSRRCVFSPAATQSANHHGQSLDDVVSALKQALESKGYSGY